MGLRHMHPVRDETHDDRRHWRQRSALVAEVAQLACALAHERQRNRRLAELLGEQAAELVVLRSARDRRATA